jgi:ABC-type uncharacterized transport system involved in gliding motility auxiliary subunit
MVRRLGFLAVSVFLAACGGQQSPGRPSGHEVSAPPEGPSGSAPGAPPARVSTGDLPALNRASEKLVQSLGSTLEITLYVSPTPPGVAAGGKKLERLLEAYRRSSNGKLTVRRNDVKSAGDARHARASGVVPFPADPNGLYPEGGYLGIVLSYRGKSATIPLFNPSIADSAEFWITNKIREIRDGAEGIRRRVGVVSGIGGLELSDTNLVPRLPGRGSPSILSIMEQAFPFYQIEKVDLRGGAAEIDGGFLGLVITQPGRSYTDAELRRIDEFLMRGNKSLAVFASAVNLKPGDANMSARLDLHRLDRLLIGYGIQMNADAVFDHGDSVNIDVLKGGGSVITHPAIARIANAPGARGPERRLDVDFVPFSSLSELMFPFASSLTLLPNRQAPGVKLLRVAGTTATTSVERNSPIDMKLRANWKPRPPLEPRILAAVAEGSLKSAFPSPAGDKATTPASAKGPSRVLVIASSLFLTNPFAYLGNDATNGASLQHLAQPYTKHLTSTILAFKNTLDWMLNESEFAELGGKLVIRATTHANESVAMRQPAAPVTR